MGYVRKILADCVRLQSHQRCLASPSENYLLLWGPSMISQDQDNSQQANSISQIYHALLQASW